MTGEPPTRPDCTGDQCVTCGDVAVQVRVIRLLPDDLAIVDTARRGMGGKGREGGEESEIVSVALVPAAPGDTILVHAGEAIAVVREAIP